MATFLTAAGHGGSDPGAPNPFNPNRPEKVINLEVDAAFARLAQANGHTVHRMRTGDTKLALAEMVNTAKKVGAHIILEFHTNASLNSSARGVEAFAVPGTPSWSIARTHCAQVARRTGMPDRGARDASFLGFSRFTEFQQLNKIFFLAENGFITNREDEVLLRRADIIRAIAISHLAAVHAYFNWPAPREVSAVGGGLLWAAGAILACGMGVMLLRRLSVSAPATGGASRGPSALPA